MATDHSNLEPESPRDAGVDESHPRPAQEEGAHQLAAQAFPALDSRGFTKEQVFTWADAYVAQGGAGDVDAFLNWIERQEA
jgi:hypothetical protein